jgi:small subunit ribosomal protein S6
MRRYELMLLLRPDLEDDKLQAAVEKVTRAIVNGGGSLSKVSPWGKRRLAYDIGPNREASYFLIHFDIEPSQVREIERGMLITEEILRHLVTVLEERGATDELAPAAIARDDVDGDDEAVEDEDALAIDIGDEDVIPAAILEDDELPDEEGVEPGTPDDVAGAEPADEERAAG